MCNDGTDFNESYSPAPECVQPFRLCAWFARSTSSASYANNPTRPTRSSGRFKRSLKEGGIRAVGVVNTFAYLAGVRGDVDFCKVG